MNIDPENLRGGSSDLPEMSGNHANHQLHRRPGGHQGHPETPGALACQIKAYSQGPCPTCPEPERIRASGIRPGSILSTSHEQRSSLSGSRLPLGGLPAVISKDGESRAEGTGVPGGALKTPPKPRPIVERSLLHENHHPTRKTPPQTNPTSWARIPLTPNPLF
jgi:hypothetical protein